MSLSSAPTIIVKIIMPSQTLFSAKALKVDIPGGDGMLGVLPGHMKLVSTIKIGIVNIFIKDLPNRFFVYGGLAQVNPTEVNIVTEFAMAINNNSREEVESKISTLKIDLARYQQDGLPANGLEISMANNDLERYNNLLSLI